MNDGVGLDAAAQLPPVVAPVSAASTGERALTLETCHALVFADDVSAEEVEALAVSQDPQSGWVGVAQLQLIPGVYLHGPWPLEEPQRAQMNLPEWVATYMLLNCPPQRGGALPAALVGTDPVADAFPYGQPSGSELLALTRMRAIARRLAGALLVRGDLHDAPSAVSDAARRDTMPVLVQPDPLAQVNLDVYAPIWLTPDACEHVVASVLPGARTCLEAVEPLVGAPLDHLPVADQRRLETLLGRDEFERIRQAARQRYAEGLQEKNDVGSPGSGGESGDFTDAVQDERVGYAVHAPVDENRQRWGYVSVNVEAADYLPVAVRGESWAQRGVVVHHIEWRPRDLADRDPATHTRSRRKERDAARILIDAAALALVRATGGLAVDEDEFLVSFEA